MMNEPVQLVMADRPEDDGEGGEEDAWFRPCKHCAESRIGAKWCDSCDANNAALLMKGRQIAALTRELNTLKAEYKSVANAAHELAGILSRRLEKE